MSQQTCERLALGLALINIWVMIIFLALSLAWDSAMASVAPVAPFA